MSDNWLTIPAKATARVNYEVRVPNNPALRGTYWSMVMIEAIGNQPARARTEDGFTLQARLRYGIKVLTNIGNTEPADPFSDRKPSTTAAKDLQLDIENTGERVLFPSVSVQPHTAKGELIVLHGKKIRFYPPVPSGNDRPPESAAGNL